MRLAKLKIAGFKSFVDPTTVTFPSSLTGVVGPNGCGKSNIIDAVRWVMGEISAKHLRGDSMADVIFNGSATRKPLGSASVELVFDNSEGKIGGQYASYNEVALRRMVSRDGTSDYYINGVKVRRKDITQLFLGTGLGSRSYAIIEQGMISRVIEAKPEDLRAFLEEAAGISRYKERRRETESRIAHTRENLERLTDLRDEVEKQIRHLQRQAATARRYQALKDEERQLQAQLLALRLRFLDAETQTRDAEAAAREIAMQAALAQMRAVETDLERIRIDQAAKADALNEVQGRYYESGAAVTRLEQNLSHARDLLQRQRADLEQIEAQGSQLGEVGGRDRHQLSELAIELSAMEPKLAAAHEHELSATQGRDAADHALTVWQSDWDRHSDAHAQAQRETQVERARIEQLDSQQHRLLQQRDRLQSERAELIDRQPQVALNTLAEREADALKAGQAAEVTLHEHLTELAAARDQEREQSAALIDLRRRLHDAQGTQVSLQALQTAALGKAAGKVSRWLASQSLADQPRLAQQLRVDRGWERAVETVLGSYLEAVCVEGLDAVAGVLDSFEGGELAVVAAGESPKTPANGATLLAKVHGTSALSSLLAAVYVAGNLNEALARRHKLTAGESVVTRDGVWMGRDWLRLSRDADPRAGVIEREETLRRNKSDVDRLAREAHANEQQLESTRVRVTELEDRREQLQTTVNRLHREHLEFSAQFQAGSARSRDEATRLAQMAAQIADIDAEINAADAQLRLARSRLQNAIEGLAQLEPRRQQLESDRERLRASLGLARGAAQSAQQVARDLAVQLESRRSAHGSLTIAVERMAQQLVALLQRRDALAAQVSGGDLPLQTLRSQLDQALGKRVEVENEMRAARLASEALEGLLRERDEARMAAERAVEEARSAWNDANMGAQQVRVRREGVAEQFAATRFDLATVTGQLAADAGIAVWEAELAQTTGKIERLGQVNLAAIDEFKEQAERKEYLDRQNKDLTDALDMLESAMRKIDRETRTRFSDTFDRVNAGLKEKFPRLFGGGHAYLELEGDDSLQAGVSVMARPPGKRNSSIHQLSGGEKALTAVALVFAIFELNPAPFCLLDEVDAPLDDNNVGRFCEIVREMSGSVQFVFITHNKSTMELASQLVGVTMHEPGVSRLVAVDVDEAVRMAAG